MAEIFIITDMGSLQHLQMFFLAIYQKNGQPAEKILRYYLQARFVRPKVRPYKTRNYYALLMKGDDTRDSVSEKE